MKKLVFVIFILCSLSVNAQSAKELRDSLAVAADSLAFHPDSVDLRLKKAAWNLQLGQWEYARAEYDYVLKLEKNNVTAYQYKAYVLSHLNFLWKRFHLFHQKN